MRKITGYEIAKAIQGTVIGGNAEIEISSVSTDTRTLKQGDLFIPLAGDDFDGHDFIDEAINKGSSGLFIDRPVHISHDDLLVIKVEDTLKALQDLAVLARSKTKAKLVAITGSSGKTTTRSLFESIAGRQYRIVSSPMNYNNEIGVPLTILAADEKTEVIIVEMAMRGLNQIAELCDIASPDIGCITNVGKTHYELLGSEENIGKAKGELAEALDLDDILILNEDDAWTQKYRIISRARIVSYGINTDADVQAANIKLIDGSPHFRLKMNKVERDIKLAFLGAHNVYNALAASALAFALEIDIEEIAMGLAGSENQAMRMQMSTTSDGINIINDSYNANPDSMKAALELLEKISQKRKIAVLGDMLELGAISDSEHERLGRRVADLDIDLLIAVGDKARIIAETALAAGMDDEKVRYFVEAESAVEFLKEMLEPEDTVLVKASRALKFERIVDGIVS